jgi:hypothetical protein
MFRFIRCPHSGAVGRAGTIVAPRTAAVLSTPSVAASSELKPDRCLIADSLFLPNVGVSCFSRETKSHSLNEHMLFNRLNHRNSSPPRQHFISWNRRNVSATVAPMLNRRHTGFGIHPSTADLDSIADSATLFGRGGLDMRWIRGFDSVYWEPDGPG